MRWLILLSIIAILIAPPIASAALVYNPSNPQQEWNCNHEPEFKTPGLPYTTNDWAKDCSICPEGSECWMNWYKKATVSGVKNANLIPQINGDPSVTRQLNRKLSGTGTTGNITSDSNINWAIKPELLTSHPELYAYGPAISTFEADRRNRYLAECQSLGIPLSTCHEQLPDASLNLGTRKISNSLMNDSQTLRTTNIKELFKQIKADASHHLDCLTNPDQDTQCNTKFMASANKSSQQLAEEINGLDSYTDLLHHEKDKTTELMSFENTNRSSWFYLVIFPYIHSPESDETGFLRNLLERLTITPKDAYAYVFQGSYAGVPTVYEAQKDKHQRLNPPDRNLIKAMSNPHPVVANQTVSSSTPPTSNTTQNQNSGGNIVHHSIITNTTNPTHKLLLQKINESGSDCTAINIPQQTLGSVASSRSDGTVNFSWRFILDLLNLTDNTVPEMPAYRACLIEPFETEAIDRLTSTDADATGRTMFSPRYATGFDQAVGIPLPLEADNPSARTETVDYKDCSVMIPCDPSKPNAEQCCSEKPYSISYGDTAPQAVAKGGSLSHINYLQIQRMQILSIKDPQRMTCNEPYSAQAFRMAQSADVDLAAITGFTSLNLNPNLPACLKASAQLPSGSQDYSCSQTWTPQTFPNPAPFAPSNPEQHQQFIQSNYPTNTHLNTQNLPNPNSVGCLIEYAKVNWPNSKFTPSYINRVVDFAIQNGWSPTFLLALWLEESHAGSKSSREFGCGYYQGFEAQLSCLANDEKLQSYKNGNYADFLCLYAGSPPNNCTFAINPTFVKNLSQFYNILTQTQSQSL
jgi:hypothetical protein